MNKSLSNIQNPSKYKEDTRLMKEFETILVITDVQEKLIKAIQKKEELISNISYLVKACEILDVKVICTEQMPDKLGSTIDLNVNTNHLLKISKDSFSCCQNQRFISFLQRNKMKNIILCGIESHICIQQTALDLLSRGYKTYLAGDAIASRDKYDHKISIKRMADAGAILGTVESIIYELCKNSIRKEFKEINSIIKERMSKKTIQD